MGGRETADLPTPDSTHAAPDGHIAPSRPVPAWALEVGSGAGTRPHHTASAHMWDGNTGPWQLYHFRFEGMDTQDLA